MIGGYANEGPLTAEHMKLPPEMRRRVGQSIRVVSVKDRKIIYQNLLSGLTHTFVKKADATWKWSGSTGVHKTTRLK